MRKLTLILIIIFLMIIMANIILFSTTSYSWNPLSFKFESEFIDPPPPTTTITNLSHPGSHPPAKFYQQLLLENKAYTTGNKDKKKENLIMIKTK